MHVRRRRKDNRVKLKQIITHPQHFAPSEIANKYKLLCEDFSLAIFAPIFLLTFPDCHRKEEKKISTGKFEKSKDVSKLFLARIDFQVAEKIDFL